MIGFDIHGAWYSCHSRWCVDTVCVFVTEAELTITISPPCPYGSVCCKGKNVLIPGANLSDVFHDELGGVCYVDRFADADATVPVVSETVQFAVSGEREGTQFACLDLNNVRQILVYDRRVYRGRIFADSKLPEAVVPHYPHFSVHCQEEGVLPAGCNLYDVFDGQIYRQSGIFGCGNTELMIRVFPESLYVPVTINQECCPIFGKHPGDAGSCRDRHLPFLYETEQKLVRLFQKFLCQFDVFAQFPFQHGEKELVKLLQECGVESPETFGILNEIRNEFTNSKWKSFWYGNPLKKWTTHEITPPSRRRRG